MAQASRVELRRDPNTGGYALYVDGELFWVKGVGVSEAVGSEGTDYLKMAREMGANSVRTWGTDQGNERYLDTAAHYGLKVDAGIWVNYAGGSVSYLDAGYCERKKQEIVDYVKKFKDHPAILMWNIGNETFSFTHSETERVALAKFLEEVYEAVHKLDPNHPIVFASSEDKDFRYIDQYMPSLDIVGINVYNQAGLMHGRWKHADLRIPYLLTEFGPPGFWESPRDENGKPIEISDVKKSGYYKKAVQFMKEHSRVCLGGFAFHLGRCPQTSMTWFNLSYGAQKTASFWELYRIYTGQISKQRAPLVKKFELSKTNQIKPGEAVSLSYSVQDPDRDSVQVSFHMGTSDDSAIHKNTDWPLSVRKLEKNSVSFKAPAEQGVYRVYLLARDGRGNGVSANKTIAVAL